MTIPLNIIRIKRKATESPLTSLVIQEGERAKKRLKDDTKHSFKDNSPGLFRLAQTVGAEWSGQAKELARLNESIQEDQANKKIRTVSDDTVPPVQTSVTESPVPRPEIPQTRRYRVIKPAHSQSRKVTGVEPYNRQQRSGKLASSQDFRFIDAQLDKEPVTRQPNQSQSPQSSTVGRKPEVPVASSSKTAQSLGLEPDSDMEDMAKFLPMLTESLGLNETAAVPAKPSSTLLSKRAMQASGYSEDLTSSRSSLTSIIADEDGEWVYDLYYREIAPANGCLGANGIDAGLGPFGDGVMIGALAGLDELLDDDEDLGSDSEEEDEVDEDSNEENFYRNDYPDEESPSPSSSPERFTMRNPVMKRNQNPTTWGMRGSEEYYDVEDDSYLQDSEEEEQRMPEWKRKMTTLQRKLRGEERERDRNPFLSQPVDGLDDDEGDEDQDDDSYDDHSDGDEEHSD